MLVVAANVGITDGTLVRSAAASAGLVTAVERAAVRAGFGRDGRYTPLDRVDVVLAGDTFDWLVSAAWCGDVKPWHGGTAARAARARVAHAAVACGRRLVAAAVRWARRGIGVPVADARGRPRLGQNLRVPVRVIALAGDRDPWLGEFAAAAARHGIVVGECWSDDAVLVRHGHELDPSARRPAAGGQGQPTLAESVAVDLVARFALAAVRDPGASPAVQRLVRMLAASRAAEIPLRVADWAATAIGQPDATVAVARLDDLWRTAVAAWFTAARRCVPSCEVEFDCLSSLAAWFDGAFRRGTAVAIPPSIQRIAPTPGSGEDPRGARLVFGHAAENDGPSVRVRRGAGWESLVPREPTKPVVTIVAPADREAGGRIVDAA